MSKVTKEQRRAVDAFAQFALDITGAPSEADAQRLRSYMASALRAQLRRDPALQAFPPATTRLAQVVPETARASLLEDVDTLNKREAAGEAAGEVRPDPRVIVRREPRSTLLLGTPVDNLTGLAPGERLGPFSTEGGIDVWFDVYFAARRMEVRQTGSALPDIVFTQARPPGTRRATTSIDIEPGTVWIRGALIDGALPPSAFVGIKVTGGSLKINQNTTINDNVIEISAPLKGVLQLALADDQVAPKAGACTASDAQVSLPDSLTFTFGSGTSTVEGTSGKAKVWGQTFEFGSSTGTWIFVPRLWTVVLTYDVSPDSFDADPIGDDLVHFEGTPTIDTAGLGLPVVVTTDPTILGEAASAAEWLLQFDQLTARWYSPDPRPHQLVQSWLAISGFGATIVADAIAPLLPPVSHTFALWNVAGTSKRLPWRQSYVAPFFLFYRCHVVDGEDLFVQGQVDVALDRPVTTDGRPFSTPTTQGALFLHEFGGTITAHLGALVADKQETLQFALRNALVWTTAPAFIFIQGQLPAPGSAQVDAGLALLLFGVYYWAPTLPDPYVSNVFIRHPERRVGAPRSLLLARLAWSTPDVFSLAFEGQLSSGLALGGRDASSGEPRPAPRHERGPDVGLTQVAQDKRTFDRVQALAWRRAQNDEEKGRGRREEIALAQNKKASAAIDNYMIEAAGPVPSLLLLDVSTNQDLLGVAFGGRVLRETDDGSFASTSASGAYPVNGLAVHSQVTGMRVVALPQVQWEPVRTLDADQDIMIMGWFPTPLAAANDGGATQIGARYQKLVPIIPEDALGGTFDAYKAGTSVGIRTTFPFGLVGVVRLQPQQKPDRKPDLYSLTRPKFTEEPVVGGIQVTARAEGGRPDNGGISAMFEGQMHQLLNGVDLPSGVPLGISVLGSTGDPAGSVEKVFNDDMGARPRVPVTRIDISGYGGSNLSDWNNPFAAYAEAAKVQFRYMIGRTALEVIKVNSVLHPWGVRVTRSVTIERRPGGGVIRRDSGWQAFTPGIFDYRYADTAGNIIVAPYSFDAGVFRGLFNVRNIRPAPGTAFTHGAAQLVPYYFDADVALEGMAGVTPGIGILGFLQTAPNGVPAGEDALQALIEEQGPVGGPVDAWINFGGSGLPFRARRVEVGLAMSGATPLFVGTVRGAPKLPKTGAWSVVTRPVANVPPNGGEANQVAENRGVPVIRRYPVRYVAGDRNSYAAPRLDPAGGPPGDYRFADATDLLVPNTPANDYALIQSTPTHAFLFPRPFVSSASAPRIETGYKPALADIYARSTTKGAFPPPGNSIEMAAGASHFDVAPDGRLSLSPDVSINGYPTALRLAGTTGHGSTLLYDTSTIRLVLDEDRWEAEFTGLRLWSDISGLERISGSEMRIVGSTEQRPQIAEIKTLVLQEIEDILQYIPLFGARGTQGPIDLGATNAKHEFKVEVELKLMVPPPAVIATFPAGSGVKLTLSVKQSTGIDLATGGPKASAIFGAELEGKVPLLSVGVATVFLIITGKITFSLTSVSGSVTAEKLDLLAFVGIGVEGKIGPFKAYAFLGVGFVLVYDAIANVTKYGGLVALEAGVDLTIVQVKIRAELKGLVYKSAGKTKCDYSGSVKIEVDIFLIFSISASYEVTDTTSF
jgi:hypothetical protein